MNLGVLASGGLGAEILSKIAQSYVIRFVCTDKHSDEIIQFATDKKIPIFIGNPRNGKAFAFCKEIAIDVLVSVNYLFLIEEDLVKLPTRCAFNIHGSLLPKYRGRTPHVWSIINNESETGITAHLIDTGCDTGAILQQTKVAIDYNDTGAMILEKYKQLYYPLITSVLQQIEDNTLSPLQQDHMQATYFGKRTADDGQINWDWQKERIRNWVRAQAKPYPGAFTYAFDKKVIIDQIEFDSTGFTADMENGLVISTQPLLIKTPNGVVKVTQLRESNINIEVGQVLK